MAVMSRHVIRRHRARWQTRMASYPRRAVIARQWDMSRYPPRLAAGRDFARIGRLGLWSRPRQSRRFPEHRTVPSRPVRMNGEPKGWILIMPRGDKSKYTGKQKRKAEHIEKGYMQRGLSRREAERRAWATVNATHGGGEKPGGGGYGKPENRAPARKGGRLGGRAAAARPAAARSASARKAARTRRRRRTAARSR